MKFTKKLELESIPEWRDNYLDYKTLEHSLKKVEHALKVQERELNNHYNSRKQRLGDSTTSNSINDDNNDDDHHPLFQHPIRPSPHASTLSEGYISSSISQPRIAKIFGGKQRDGSLPSHGIRAWSSELGASPSLQAAMNKVPSEERHFFRVLNDNMEKVDKHYKEKEHEAAVNLEQLKETIRDASSRQPQQTREKDTDCLSEESESTIQQAYVWLRRRLSQKVTANLEPPVVIPMEDVKPPERSQTQTRRIKNSQLKDSENADDIAAVSYNRQSTWGPIKYSMIDFYRSIESLNDFRIINRAGFVKILKKFDNIAGWAASGIYLSRVNNRSFLWSTRLDEIMKETEKIYIEYFAIGERKKALSHLRAPRETHIHHSAAWRSGLYVGLSFPPLIMAITNIANNTTPRSQSHSELHIQFYASFFVVIIFALGFGLNMMVWKRYRINYKSIFEFNPGNSLDYRQYTEFAALFFLLLSVCAYFNFATGLATPEFWRGTFLVASGIILFFPIRSFLSARRWLLESLGRILLSGFINVEFRDFFIADELNSLSYSFHSIRYIFCDPSSPSSSKSACIDDNNYRAFGILTGIIFGAIPSYWRLAQCLRRYSDSGGFVYHMINAGKYMTSIIVVLAMELVLDSNIDRNRNLYLFLAVVNSIYTSIWDIRYDWGLLYMKSKYFLLRNDLLYPPPVYYLAIFTNIFLRFSWGLKYLNYTDSHLPTFFIALGEVYRRFQWNFLRLENEHLLVDDSLSAEYPRSRDDRVICLNSPDYQPSTAGGGGGQTPATVRTPQEADFVSPHEEIGPSRGSKNGPSYISTRGPSRASMYGQRDFDKRLEPLRNITGSDTYWNEIGVDRYSGYSGDSDIERQ